MKKNLYNKISKVLVKNGIVLSYDIYKQKTYVNDIPFTDKSIKSQPWFKQIQVSTNTYDDKDTLCIIIEFAQKNSFNSNDIKEAEKAEKNAKKEAEKVQKEAEKAEKNAKKEAEKAQKEAEKVQKEAEKVQKEAETNAKIEAFIENFDYNILENIPKSSYINIVKITLSKAGLPTKQIIYNRIISKYTLTKTIQQKEKFESLGYLLNDDGKPDSENPVNYEVFFENFFMSKDEWNKIEDKSKVGEKRYCYFDEWQNTYNLYDNNGNIMDAVPERIRTLVRQYAPIKNIYVVNDMYRDWIKDNRKDNALLDYIRNLKWDGKDRLGLNIDNNTMNDNENLVLKVLNANQSVLNKKMLNYSLIHACRQMLWPTRYNFQHILCLLGDTNCGKTKTLQDLFTFPCGIYYSEGLDINGAKWTIGETLKRCVAILWNEKQGINSAENETLKNFIDLINGQYKYQEKNRQEEITYISHNICFITYNPKQKPLLTDYSVSYEKRYFPLECKQNEQTFKEKYLHTIEEEREQIWAQIYEWTINNEDAVNELDNEDINELKVIQERNKGITKEDILTKIDYWLNEKTYNKQRIIDIDEIKQSEKQTDNYNKNTLLSISITAFEELLKYIGYDSRHKSFIDKEMMYNIGWEKKPTTINNRSVNAWVRMKDKQQPSLPI